MQQSLLLIVYCLVAKEILLQYGNKVGQIFALKELRLNIHQIFKRDSSKVSQVTATTKPQDPFMIPRAKLHQSSTIRTNNKLAFQNGRKSQWVNPAPKTKGDRNSLTNSLLDYQEVTTLHTTNTWIPTFSTPKLWYLKVYKSVVWTLRVFSKN